MCGEVDMISFLAPIRLVRCISKPLQAELVDKYESNFGESFPWDVVLRSLHLNDLYWMDQDLTVEEYNRLFKEKLDAREDVKLDSNLSRPVKDLSDSSTCGTGINLVLSNLVWWNDSSITPGSLGKDGIVRLDSWFESTLDSIGVENIPAELFEHLEKFSGRVGCSQITWRSLYMDPVFSTFIARLFQDSFRSGVVRQDFRLTFDREVDTLLGLIYRFVGTKKINESLRGVRLDVFNSSSIACNLLLRLITD
jgi:hypothetical protein